MTGNGNGNGKKLLVPLGLAITIFGIVVGFTVSNENRITKLETRQEMRTLQIDKDLERIQTSLDRIENKVSDLYERD